MERTTPDTKDTEIDRSRIRLNLSHK